MKKNSRVFVVMFAAGIITLLHSCQKDDQIGSRLNQGEFSRAEANVNQARTFYSSTLPIGNGVGRAWVSENTDGDPVSVGFTMSEKALENLPDEPAEYVFILPKNKGENFYKHVLIDWNPQGHEPEPIYGLPHFDFHFYIVSNEARMAIGPNDNAQFDNLPDSKFGPPFYLRGPGGVPQMGVHWVDLLAPEFNGGIFTKTFIWGSYDGKFIFWEPMITRDYLLSHPNEITTLRQPSAYQQDGFYATQYKVSYSVSPKEYTIALLNLVYHSGE